MLLILLCNPITWTASDVEKWLVSISMEKYVQAFKEAPIDGKSLRYMDDKSLRDLGVLLSAYRKNLLASIAELYGEGLCYTCCRDAAV